MPPKIITRLQALSFGPTLLIADSS